MWTYSIVINSRSGDSWCFWVLAYYIANVPNELGFSSLLYLFSGCLIFPFPWVGLFQRKLQPERCLIRRNVLRHLQPIFYSWRQCATMHDDDTLTLLRHRPDVWYIPMSESAQYNNTWTDYAKSVPFTFSNNAVVFRAIRAIQVTGTV